MYERIEMNICIIQVLVYVKSFLCLMLIGDQLNHPNVGLVVTYGKSNNQKETFAQAMQNRDSSIEMLAVGVGRNYRYMLVR